MSAASVTFRAELRSNGKTATGIEVPPDVVGRLGTSKRPAVRVTIKGHTYRSTVAVMGGVFMLPVSAANRDAAGVSAGDQLDVELVLDDAPREVDVPPDLAAALAADDSAKRFFDEALSYSNKRWYVLWIEGAKKDETRQRRVAQAVEMLRDGKKQG